MEMVKTACRSVVEGEGEEQRKSGSEKNASWNSIWNGLHSRLLLDQHPHREVSRQMLRDGQLFRNAFWDRDINLEVSSKYMMFKADDHLE